MCKHKSNERYCFIHRNMMNTNSPRHSPRQTDEIPVPVPRTVDPVVRHSPRQTDEIVTECVRELVDLLQTNRTREAEIKCGDILQIIQIMNMGGENMGNDIAYEDVLPELKRLFAHHETVFSRIDRLKNVCKIFDIIISPNGQLFAKRPNHSNFLSVVKFKYNEFVQQDVMFPAEKYAIVLTM